MFGILELTRFEQCLLFKLGVKNCFTVIKKTILYFMVKLYLVNLCPTLSKVRVQQSQFCDQPKYQHFFTHYYLKIMNDLDVPTATLKIP